MNDNKADKTKFTLQFSKTDPSHLQVVDILNRQGRRSKAQYLVNAVLHFENCSATPTMQWSSGLDIKMIEAVVNRLLQEKESVETAVPTAVTMSAEGTTPIAVVKETPAESTVVITGTQVAIPIQIEQQKPVIRDEVNELSYDDALDVFGEEGFNAVANTLDLFRKK